MISCSGYLFGFCDLSNSLSSVFVLFGYAFIVEEFVLRVIGCFVQFVNAKLHYRLGYLIFSSNCEIIVVFIR